MKILLSLLLILSFASLHAQTEAQIRSHYQEVNKMIVQSKEAGYEGELYNNRWIANAQGRSWPAVGIYADTTDFWYDDPPDHLPESERPAKNTLLKVEIRRHASHYYVTQEYLFKDGKLIFYYSNEAEEGHGWETRVWFSNEAVLKTNVRVNELEITPKDHEYQDVAPDIQKIKANAKEFQELFVKSMR